jgi:O-antigen/teichoic acid export membrane protein
VPSTATDVEFKRTSVRGGAAVLFGQGFGSVLQIGTTIILARLLSPTDYGIQSMVLSLTNFFSLFRDAGLSSAAVQCENLTNEQASTLFWINLALGASLMGLVCVASPALVIFYREPRLLWVTLASSSVFLFSSLSFQHHAMLDRALRFTTSAKIAVLSATIGAAVAIGMSALGYRYWALIVQNICIPLVDAAAVWIVMPWRPGAPRRGTGIRSMVRFGGFMSLNRLVVYLAYNSEKILLGRYWGAAALGLYGRAYQLANLPVQQLIDSVGSVAFPVLSRMQKDPERLRRSYMKFHSVVVSMMIPVVIACLVFADQIVGTILGPKWIGSAVVLRLLAPTVLVFAIVNPLQWLLKATGQFARSLKISFLLGPVVILGIVAGLRYGPPGVATGYSAAMLVLCVPLAAWAKYRTVVSTADYWDCIKWPMLSGAISGIAGWLFLVAFQHSLAPIALLALGVSLMCTIYVLVLFTLGQKEMYVDALRQLFQRSDPLSGQV